VLEDLPEGWTQQIRQAGYRLTRPRQAVLRVLAESEVALTVAEVHRRARARYPRLGLVTVYRTLDLLLNLGLVHRLPGEVSGQLYVRADLHPHGHLLICRSCHRAVEIPCTGLEEMTHEVERQTGFAVQGHWLELFGLCPACREGTDGG